MVGQDNRVKKRTVAVNEAGHIIGEFHPRAVLTDHEIDLMFELREQGFSYGWLAVKFEITKGACWKIIQGLRRGHVAARWRVVSVRQKG
jgi:hypothetical protein